MSVWMSYTGLSYRHTHRHAHTQTHTQTHIHTHADKGGEIHKQQLTVYLCAWSLCFYLCVCTCATGGNGNYYLLPLSTACTCECLVCVCVVCVCVCVRVCECVSVWVCVCVCVCAWVWVCVSVQVSQPLISPWSSAVFACVPEMSVIIYIAIECHAQTSHAQFFLFIFRIIITFTVLISPSSSGKYSHRQIMLKNPPHNRNI